MAQAEAEALLKARTYKNSKALQLSFSAVAVMFLPEEEEATTRVVVVGAVSLKEKEIHRYF